MKNYYHNPLIKTVYFNNPLIKTVYFNFPIFFFLFAICMFIFFFFQLLGFFYLFLCKCGNCVNIFSAFFLLCVSLCPSRHVCLSARRTVFNIIPTSFDIWFLSILSCIYVCFSFFFLTGCLELLKRMGRNGTILSEKSTFLYYEISDIFKCLNCLKLF